MTPASLDLLVAIATANHPNKLRMQAASKRPFALVPIQGHPTLSPGGYYIDRFGTEASAQRFLDCVLRKHQPAALPFIQIVDLRQVPIIPRGSRRTSLTASTAMIRPFWITDLAEWERLRKQLLDTAAAIASGNGRLVENTRVIVSLGHRLRDDAEDFRVFVGIDSVTDHLPVGHLREVWHPEALAGMDAEREACEQHYEGVARQAAASIAARYGRA